MEKYKLLKEIIDNTKSINKSPVIVCIGSNKVVGDCLGPMVGQLLIDKYKTPTFIYGTMDNPINARNVTEVSNFIKSIHKSHPIIAIDAAVGKLDNIGKIKVYDDGIYPGLATGKFIDKVGTHSIIGIVEENSYFNTTLLKRTRLTLVYEMATLIAETLNDYIITRNKVV